MGFPSPAQDYIQRPISLNDICNVTTATVIAETSEGIVVIDRYLKPSDGDTALVLYAGHSDFMRVSGSTLVTREGCTITGDELDDAEVIGVVTHTLTQLHDDGAPF